MTQPFAHIYAYPSAPETQTPFYILFGSIVLITVFNPTDPIKLAAALLLYDVILQKKKKKSGEQYPVTVLLNDN